MNIFDKIKKYKKLIIIILLISTLSILSVFITYKIIKYNQLDNVRFEREYEKLNNKETDDGKEYPLVDIPTNNVIKYSSMKEIIDIIKNKEDAVVYLGYASCLYCRTAVQVLCDTAEKTEIDKIYYVDVYERDVHYDELLKILGKRFVINEDKVDKLRIPLLLFIVDGNIVSFNRGTIISHTNPYEKLNETQLYALDKIYTSGINDVLAGMQN